MGDFERVCQAATQVVETWYDETTADVSDENLTRLKGLIASAYCKLLPPVDTAARLAVVPSPEGDVVEAAVRAVMADVPDEADSTVCERMEQWTRGVLRDAAPIIIAAEREACAAYADQWSKPQVVKLAAGEMTAQELRTAQAVAKGIAAAIRAGGRDV